MWPFKRNEEKHTVRGFSGNFGFSEFKDGKTLEFSDSAPIWRKSVDGLNLEGYCKDKNCKAYNKTRVIIPWGYNNFDWLMDEYKCKCPLCGKYVKPETCGFTNAKWKYKGKVKEDGKAPVDKSCDWQIAKANKYFTFYDAEQKSWNSLLIEVKRP